MDFLPVFDVVAEDGGVGAASHEGVAGVQGRGELELFEESFHGRIGLQLLLQVTLPLFNDSVAPLLEVDAAIEGFGVRLASSLVGQRKVLVPVREALGTAMVAKNSKNSIK